MAKPFDVTTKELVEMYPEDWLRFLGLPDAPMTIADADLSTFSPEADKVIRVDDPNGGYTLHIEFQSSYDGTLDDRVLRYHVLLQERFGLPVISVVFLLRPNAEGEGVTGRVVETTPQGMNRLDFHYLLIRVWEIPVERLLEEGLALLPLASVSQVSAEEARGVIKQMDRRLLAETSPGEYAKLWTATYLMMGLRYTEAMIDILLQGVRNMRESVTYQAILREGREEGIEEGREEGKARFREVILLGGEKRFGSPNAQVKRIIETLSDFEQLETLTIRLFEVESWSELLAYPADNAPTD